MTKILSIWNAAKAVLGRIFPSDFFKMILKPCLEDARFFYLGFFAFVLSNAFFSILVSVVLTALAILIAEISLVVYKGRPLYVRDYFFGLLPSIVLMIDIWIRN